eukprot:symbB.v1.2.027455.t1/scaffold2821.1/size70050/1
MAPAERSDQALEQWLPVIDGLHIGQLVEIEAKKAILVKILDIERQLQLSFCIKMQGCFSCWYCFSKREIKCLERRKKALKDKIQSLQRDVAYAEDDQEKHERLIAKHQALRNSLRSELQDLGQKVQDHRNSHDSLLSQVQQSRLQLEEICAARDRLKEQVASEAQELQVVEVECKRATLDLESAREEKEQIEAQVMRQREENSGLRSDFERASLEAAAIRAKMLAAKEETDEATKALKELIDGLGTLTSANLPPKASKVLTIDGNHERFTQVLVTGPPEVVKAPVPRPDQAELLSPRGPRNRCSPGSSTPVHGAKTPRTPGMMPAFRGKSLSPPFSANGRNPTPVTARSPTPTSGASARKSPASEGPPSAEDAVSQARRCLRDVENQHGSKSKQAIHAATELALQLEEITPATKEAGQLLRRALEDSIGMYGSDHLNTLRTVNNLAVYLDNIGEKEEALRLYRWARDGRLKQLGPTHPYTLDSIYNLASFLLYDNQLTEAKAAFISARNGCVECFGWTHQGTLDCTERMVDILEAEGNLQEAVEVCKELLGRSEEMHSKDHPQTLRVLVTLTSLLAACGRMAEAEESHLRAIQRHEAAFGFNHAKTLELTYGLVEYYSQNNKMTEAEQLLREKILHCEDIYGTTTAVVLGYVEDLAICLENSGKLEESESLFRRVLSTRKRMLGAEHEDTLRSMSNLAVLLERSNRAEEALKLYQQCQAGKAKVFGLVHPKTLESTLGLGVCLAETGRTKEAEAVMQGLYAELEAQNFSPDHEWVLLCTDKLGELAKLRDDLRSAEEMFRRSYQARITQQDCQDTELANSAYNFAVCLAQQGQDAEAEACFRQAVEAYTRAFGAEDPYTLDAVFNLAMSLEDQGKKSDAERLYQAAADGRARAFGVDHADTLQAEEALMMCRSGSRPLAGERGQLISWVPEQGVFEIALLRTGRTVSVDPKDCHTVINCQGPATGGGPESFDIVIGPRTNRDALGEALSNSLLERGFCVLRIIQRDDDLQQMQHTMKQFDTDGRLCRLATEVEEGYLGKGGRGKVMWLDPEDPSVPNGSVLRRNDANITSLAEILQPFAEDVLGAPIAERTPAMACMSMTDAEEAVYEHPTASDTIIEEFYGNWARSVLRVVHFMGPGECKVELSCKEDAPLKRVDESYEITAGPNTILVVRQDTFDFWCDEPEDESDAFWLQAFLLRAGPSWTMGDLVDGDLSLLVSRGEGPPPPSGPDVVAVVALSLQACGKMTDHHKEPEPKTIF